MRIAIPSTGEGEDSRPDDRFGRCSCFAVFDTASETWSFVPNGSRRHEHGAGIAAARRLIEHDVDVVIGPRLGPNAAQVLEQASITCLPLPRRGSETVEAVLRTWLQEERRH